MAERHCVFLIATLLEVECLELCDLTRVLRLCLGPSDTL